MRLSLTNFMGIRPKIASDLLPEGEAQTAENCKLSNGQLRPWDNYLFTQLLNLKNTIRTIYLYEGQYWLEFDADVDILPAPISGDTAAKLFYTGDGIPKKTNLTEATTGSGAMPINFYPLPLPTPKDALTGTPGSGGSGDDREVTYLWTILTTWGEESYPSPASAVITAKNGQTVALAGMSMIWKAGTAYLAGEVVFKVASEGGTYMYMCVTAGTSGAAEPTWVDTVDANTIDNTVLWRCYKNNIASKKIYRLATGDQYAVYGLVTTIAVAATSHSDISADDDLGATCPSLNIASGGSAEADWDPPPLTLQGLTYMSNGICLAFVGKDIYASIPYRPWAWPIAYRNSIVDNIVAIASYGNTAVIMTDKYPYLVTGTSPASLTIERLPEPRPCVSKRGTVGHDNGIIYPSSDGLYMIGTGGEARLTKDYYGVDEWQALHPSTMHAVIHDNKYFGFYSEDGVEGGIVIDLQTGVITTLDFYPSAIYREPETDTLYFLRSDKMTGFSEQFEYPDAASTDGMATQKNLNAAGALAGIVQPDFPRNVVLNITDANGSLSAIQVTVTGTLATGETGQTEVFTDKTAGIHLGSKAFAHIDSITVDSVAGGTTDDKLDIGYGKKFGLANGITASDDIWKVNIDDTDSPVASQTINTTYDTIQFASDPDGSCCFQVWYGTD